MDLTPRLANRVQIIGSSFRSAHAGHLTDSHDYKTGRYIGRCKCKKVYAFDMEPRNTIQNERVALTPLGWIGRHPAGGWFVLCECGRSAEIKRVLARVTDHVCNDKCVSAAGHQCDCSCGGANHGKNHVKL